MTTREDRQDLSSATTLVLRTARSLEKGGICELTHKCEELLGNKERSLAEEQMYNLILTAHEFYHSVFDILEVTAQEGPIDPSDIN